MGTQTVWLVGLMGAGKSTVGGALAQRLGRAFIDTDAEIERDAGCSVAEIFATEGEAAFRRREREKIELLQEAEAVVALGGGAIAQPGAARLLRAAGTVVYLRASPEALLARLGDCQSRPLLRDFPAEERLERLRSLLAERRDAYESAQIIIDTDGLAAAVVVDSLGERLGEVCG